MFRFAFSSLLPAAVLGNIVAAVMVVSAAPPDAATGLFALGVTLAEPVPVGPAALRPAAPDLAAKLACGDPEILHRWQGGFPAERFGAAVAGGFDANGDGWSDVVIGAYRAGPAGAATGAVTVFSGLDGVPLHALTGPSAGGWYGFAVAGLSDRNGDGFDDFAVGAPYGASGKGSVSVHSGADGAVVLTLVGAADGGQFGAALAGLQDVDGDGIDELIVGAPAFDAGGLLAGRVEVFSGVDGTSLWRMDGGFGDYLGRSVCDAGDVDGDGLHDVLVGASLSDSGAFNAGSAFVYSGVDGVELLGLHGAEVGAQLGDRVARIGDVDLDGRPDFALGVPGADAAGIDSGAAEIRSADDGRVLLVIPGGASGQTLHAVAAAGDYDRDGVADVAVGEALGGALGQNGRVRVVSGRTGETLLCIEGDRPADWLGAALGSAGDVNGDGSADLVIGAPGSDDDLEKAGYALVVRGGRPRPRWSPRVPRKDPF